MDKVTVTQEAREAAAIRHSFDGYGWAYIDSGSGSDWHRRGMAEPYAELLYTSDDLASAFAAGHKAGLKKAAAIARAMVDDSGCLWDSACVCIAETIEERANAD